MQNKYEILEIVGEGAFGIVMKCKNRETGEIVAIKKFKDSDDEIVQKSMLRELKVLKKLRHDNIVQLKETFRRKGKLYLVFEYIDRNLLQLLEEFPNGLDQILIKKLIYQICKAVIFIHLNDIIHRDIKPENILVTYDNIVKICDFGFARGLPNKGGILTDYVATRWYRAPELLLSSTNYGREVDIWALGCIIGELTDGQPMFPGDNELGQLILVQKLLGNLPQQQLEIFYSNPMYSGNKLDNVNKPETLERRYFGKLSKCTLSFLKAILKLDPKERISGNELINHTYFDDIRSNDSEFLQIKSTNIDLDSKKSVIHNKNSSISSININKINKFQNSKTNFNVSKSPSKETSKITNCNAIKNQIKIPKKFQVTYENTNNSIIPNYQQQNNVTNPILKNGCMSFYNIKENKDDIYNFNIDTNFEDLSIKTDTKENNNKKKKNIGGVMNLRIIKEEEHGHKLSPTNSVNHNFQNELAPKYVKRIEKERTNKFKPDTGSEFYDDELTNQNKNYISPKNMLNMPNTMINSSNNNNFNFLPQISTHRGYDNKSKLNNIIKFS